MSVLTDILHSLLASVDLGFMALPRVVLLGAMLCLFGMGLRKALLSYGGGALILAYYLCVEIAVFI